MTNRTATLLVAILLAASLLAGVLVYPYLPNELAGHWNASGEADGTVGKFFGVFFVPILAALIALLFAFAPRLDPLRRNIERFRPWYNAFAGTTIAFLFYVHALTLLWNMEVRFSMNAALFPAIGLLIYFIGVFLPHAKRNWFMGIRTPWTLSSDAVWARTHEKGGKLFRFAGLLGITGAFVPRYGIWFVLLPVIFSAVWALVYSYIVFRELERKSGR